MKINVKQHDPNDPLHIEEICLVYENADIIVLEVDLKTKYAQVDAYSGSSFWLGRNEVQIVLPESFVDNSVIFSETSRYTLFVCVLRIKTKEQVWQAPETAMTSTRPMYNPN